MEKDLLEIGQISKFKAPTGNIVYEFTRLGLKGQEHLSDNVEYKRYDSRKNNKGTGFWILVKDLPTWYAMLEKRGFVQI
jgi:hypothetical protein